MKISLRPTSIEDSDFVYQVKVDALKDYVDQTWGWNDSFQQSFHLDTFDPLETQIIQFDGVDAGFFIVVEHSDFLEIKEINLLCRFHRKGIGRFLINSVLEEAHLKSQFVQLQVLKVNPAIHLYRRLGFNCYEETETHFLMKTSLP